MIKWLEHSWNMTIWCMGHEWIIWNLDNDYFCWHCWQLGRIHNTQANIPSNADFCRVNLHRWVCPELVIMSEEHDDQPWDEIGWDWASTWDNPNWPGHQKQIQLNQHQNSKFIYRMELTLALLRQVLSLIWLWFKSVAWLSGRSISWIQQQHHLPKQGMDLRKDILAAKKHKTAWLRVSLTPWIEIWPESIVFSSLLGLGFILVFK